MVKWRWEDHLNLSVKIDRHLIIDVFVRLQFDIIKAKVINQFTWCLHHNHPSHINFRYRERSKIIPGIYFWINRTIRCWKPAWDFRTFSKSSSLSGNNTSSCKKGATTRQRCCLDFSTPTSCSSEATHMERKPLTCQQPHKKFIIAGRDFRFID